MTSGRVGSAVRGLDPVTSAEGSRIVIPGRRSEAEANPESIVRGDMDFGFSACDRAPE
jgi:hypothetical protein